jgi:hypothetical protein
MYKRKEGEENSSVYIRLKEKRKNYPNENRFGKRKNGKRKMIMVDK